MATDGRVSLLQSLLIHRMLPMLLNAVVDCTDQTQRDYGELCQRFHAASYHRPSFDQWASCLNMIPGALAMNTMVKKGPE